jgi:Niemann-Pick C1 protein
VGAYTDAVQRDSEDATGIAGLSRGMISASSFTAYYVPLSTQSDFINALSASRELAASAARDLNLNVFSYSIFHVFFEQYLTLGGEALAMLGSAAVAIFILCLVFTSNVWAGALVLGVLSMMCVDLAGIMVFTGIQMNAVSLVNLAAAVGIGVEFVVHVLHAFMEAEGSKETRMASALGHVGAAVLTGITATKFIGVFV